ncbi:MAG: SRPBCC domain-containing protein [Thermoplasmata archaeon]|nr:SRPBCC domain-containing protein [Thermoplasmata archaeon]
MVEPRNTEIHAGRRPSSPESLKTGFVLTREFRVPRQVLWSALTDPRKLAIWWGPRGATNPVCELDPRVHGALRIHSQNPDGSIFPVTGTVREVDAPRKFVFVLSVAFPPGVVPFEVLHTLRFDEHGGTTTLTLEAQPLQTTPASLEWIAGADPGWGESLERLAELVQAGPGEAVRARA